MAAGDELLVVDSVVRDRKGMRKLFEEAGYVVTALADVREARSFVESKFFPAAVVDLDVEGGALELIRFIRQRSDQTGVVLLTGRRSYEAAVEALRLGVVDVVQKKPEEVDRLEAAVGTAARRYRSATDKDSLLRESLVVMDEALKLMLGFVRRLYAEASLKSDPSVRTARVLLVDDDQPFAQILGEAGADKEWKLEMAFSGGGALDRLGSETFDVVVVRDQLQDLPGSMVVRTVQSQAPGTLALVYTDPGDQGRIDRWDAGKVSESVSGFDDAEKLLAEIDRLTGEVMAMRRERLYLAQFRREHSSFLQRFASLRRRIDTLAK